VRAKQTPLFLLLFPFILNLFIITYLGIIYYPFHPEQGGFSKMEIGHDAGAPSAYPLELRTPKSAFKQGSCFSCWRSGLQLKICTACKRVSYCPLECQKKDWNNSHKTMCKFLVASNILRKPTPPTGRNWSDIVSEKVHAGNIFVRSL
jgi:hypothetical protein